MNEKSMVHVPMNVGSILKFANHFSTQVVRFDALDDPFAKLRSVEGGASAPIVSFTLPVNT